MTLPLLITLSMAADLLTANPTQERNPLAAAILTAGFAFPAKTALVALVVATVAVIRVRRPPLARLVAGVACVAGVVGTVSNL